MPKPLLAIVVPVHNERGNLERFHQEVTAVMHDLSDYEWEFVFVDDGSRDGSFSVLNELHARDERVTALRFPPNFGSHVAIAAGIRAQPAGRRPDDRHAICADIGGRPHGLMVRRPRASLQSQVLATRGARVAVGAGPSSAGGHRGRQVRRWPRLR